VPVCATLLAGWHPPASAVCVAGNAFAASDAIRYGAKYSMRVEVIVECAHDVPAPDARIVERVRNPVAAMPPKVV